MRAKEKTTKSANSGAQVENEEWNDVDDDGEHMGTADQVVELEVTGRGRGRGKGRGRGRGRQQAPIGRKGKEKATNESIVDADSSKAKSTEKKEKILNMNTYKFHELGKYASSIQRIGTLDLVNTQGVGPSLFLIVCMQIFDYQTGGGRTPIR